MDLNPTDILDYITTDEYPKEDVVRCQNKSKEMMKVIIEILDRHKIDYIVAHGTLLGLIRHKGFIPWDDDCDLFLFDWQYARAIEVLRRELPQDMIVHNRRTDPIYWPKWTKIRDAYSDAEESLWTIDRKLRFHGICIDLLKVKIFRRGVYNTLKQWKKLKKNISKSKKIIESPTQTNIKKIKYVIKFMIYVFQYIGLQFVRQCDRTKILCANYNTVIESSFKYKDVFPIRKNELKFDGIPVCSPKNPENVLRSLYGNFMDIPPYEKRIPHYSHINFFEIDNE